MWHSGACAALWPVVLGLGLSALHSTAVLSYAYLPLFNRSYYTLCFTNRGPLVIICSDHPLLLWVWLIITFKYLWKWYIINRNYEYMPPSLSISICYTFQIDVILPRFCFEIFCRNSFFGTSISGMCVTHDVNYEICFFNYTSSRDELRSIFVELWLMDID